MNDATKRLVLEVQEISTVCRDMLLKLFEVIEKEWYSMSRTEQGTLEGRSILKARNMVDKAIEGIFDVGNGLMLAHLKRGGF